MIELSNVNCDVSDAWNKIICESDLVVYERDTSYDDDLDRDEKYICVVNLDNFLYLLSITIIGDEEHVNLTQKYKYEDLEYKPLANHYNYQKIDSDSEMKSKIVEFFEDKARHGYEDYKHRESFSLNYSQAVRKVKSEI